MDLRGLKVGDTFVGVQRGDPGRRNDPDVARDFVVTKVARKYITANCTSGWPHGVQFEREGGLEKSGFKPMVAYLDREQWEAQVQLSKRKDGIRRLMRDLSYYSLDRLSTDELGKLEELLSIAKGQ